MAQASSLAAIVTNPDPVRWKKLDVDWYPLFHQKYWGKSLEADEMEWKAQDNTQLLEPENISTGYNYAFSPHISNLPQHIWVRDDYTMAYSFFVNKCNAKLFGHTPCLVVAGQPGIGKTFWLYYVARRRVAERKPFIWCSHEGLFLFVDEGVYQLPPDWKHGDFRTQLWLLVDSEVVPDFPGRGSSLATIGTSFHIIYATSHDQSRWGRLCKSSILSYLIIMNPWSQMEIRQVALLHKIPMEKVDEIFDSFGPIPLLCIDYYLDGLLPLYAKSLDLLISLINKDVIKGLSFMDHPLQMDIVSQKICLISRENKSEIRSPHVITPISEIIKSRLANRFRELEQQEKIHLYQYFSQWYQAMAGIFYEAMVQDYLQTGPVLELFPMVKDSEPQGQLNKTGWYSSQNPLEDAQFERLQQIAVDKRLSVTISPKTTIEYPDSGPTSIDKNILYVPQSSNKKAFLSFILLDFLYIFQTTVSDSHLMNHGLLDIAKKFRFPEQDKWRFVFIIPCGPLKASSPTSLTFTPYSAVVHSPWRS